MHQRRSLSWSVATCACRQVAQLMARTLPDLRQCRGFAGPLNRLVPGWSYVDQPMPRGADSVRVLLSVGEDMATLYAIQICSVRIFIQNEITVAAGATLEQQHD